MLVTYVIDNTSGMLNFQVAPGELNGPGGTDRLTDLRLYGNGALRWGEGVDENFLRLIESFSCPAKQNTDKWFDGTNYNSEKHRLWPKGEEDGNINDKFQNGPGKGINRPITGQVWFNATDGRTYIYDHSKKQTKTVTKWAPEGIGSWASVSGIFVGDRPPTSKPTEGDMWYDTSGIICGQPQLFIYYPKHPEALPPDHPIAPGWVSSAENYVKQCGDYMSGILDMGGKTGNNKNKIINIADIESPTNPTQPHPTEANTALNVRSGDARYVNKSGDSMTGWLNLVRAIPSVTAASDDYYAVPVKLLRDYVKEAVGTFGKGAIFYGYYSYQSAQTGKATIDFNFDAWRIEYNNSTGQNVSAANFLVVCIPTFESFRVSNAAPRLAASHGEKPGSLGDYGFVTYNAGPEGSFYPKANNKQYLRIKAGPTGRATVTNVKVHGYERPYSCKGFSKIGFHFFGGPLNVLWKLRGAPRAN